MAEYRLYKSKRILCEDGELRDAGILVDPEGKIARIVHCGEKPFQNFKQSTSIEGKEPLYQIHDFGDLVIMAGLVDSHVHINEPGRTDWEGFWSGTRAAAAGGVTTLADMPLNSLPPTTTVAGLKEKILASHNKCHIDVAFWGGLVPNNKDELRGLVREGVVGFKCFLVDSGVPEFPPVTQHEAAAALLELKDTGLPLAFHAECETEECKQGEEKILTENTNYSTFLASRPPQMEVNAVKTVIQLCTSLRARCHIVHLSASESLPLVNAARSEGALLTAETCPHYLSLAAEDVPEKATQYKCCPPVRSKENKERLWAGVLSGDLSLLVTDHSPCPPQMKKFEDGNFLSAWGGISSLQLGLPLVWTEGKTRGLSLADLSRLMSHAPAQLCGLDDRKGRISEGLDADLVVWDPDKTFKVEDSMLHHRHKGVSPYLGLTLHGRILYTVLRGQIIYDCGTFSDPLGLTLARK